MARADETKPVKVAFVATQLGAERGGLARYAAELLTGLSARSDLDLTVFVQRGHADAVRSLPLGGDVSVVEVPADSALRRSLWEVARLGRAAQDFDLIHCTRNVTPRSSGVPVVLTVHDLMNITWPQQFPFLKRAIIPRQFKASMRRADILLSVSGATADRLVALAPDLADRVRVVRSGVSSTMLTAVAERPDLIEGRFALVVGDLSPRKNLGMVFGIWADVYQETGLRLVVVGPDGWLADKARTQLDQLVTSGVAIRTSHLTDGGLRWCYQNAAVVLAPSIEEGFGLPVAEALALGATVIASEDAALVETAGGHATHVSATDAGAWRGAIVEASRSGSAPRCVPFPSWDDVAARTVEVYHAAMARAS